MPLDANEQLRSRPRCCKQCFQWRITETVAKGQKREFVEGHPRQV